MNSIDLYQLKVVRVALRLECLGMRRSRAPSALAMAQKITGNKTRDRVAQLGLLNKLIGEMQVKS